MLPHELLLLGEAFEAQGWSIEGGKPPNPELFENFARLLTRLTAEERALTLKLLMAYRWVTEAERTSLLLAAWDHLVNLIPKDTVKIWMAPLMKPHSRSPKSSDAVWRSLEENLPWLRRSGFPVAPMKSATRGRTKRTAKDVLLLVDDYVGTGDTVAAALAPIRAADPTRNQDNTYILVISAHVAAAQRLSDRCRIVASEWLVRCITDGLSVNEIQPAMDLVRGISRRLGFRKDELLGYGNCESLITLARTPNNTLPMFWTNRKVAGQAWPAPFLRENDRVM